MTEGQLRSFPPFRSLPIYDECDAASTAVTGLRGPYRRVRECPTVQAVKDGLADPRLVALGGLRVPADGGSIVVAYFGEQG
jgi:hypothetical protein